MASRLTPSASLARLTPMGRRKSAGSGTFQPPENAGDAIGSRFGRSGETLAPEFPLTVQVGNVFAHTLNVGTGDQNFKWLARVVCDALARESNMPPDAFHCVNIFDSTGCSLLPFDRIQDQCRPGDVLSLHLLPPTASAAPITVNPFGSNAFVARGIKVTPPVTSPLSATAAPKTMRDAVGASSDSLLASPSSPALKSPISVP
jgi:hypothetical protein